MCFARVEDARSAIQGLHGTEVEGQKLFVTELLKKSVRNEALKRALSKVNLYIRGFGNASEQELSAFFSGFG